MAKGVHRHDRGDPATGFAIDDAGRSSLRDGLEAGSQRPRVHPQRLE